MKRPLVVVKLGGSILTNKGGRGRARFHASLASQLAKALVRPHMRRDLLIILGAGSWGHPQALRHGIGTRRLRGLALVSASEEVSASVAQLRARFCEAAHGVGLPVVPVAAPALSRGGLRMRFDVAPLRWMLDAGFVPVTGGDVIRDPRLGLRILSGDEIAYRVARAMGPQRVVFATDVPGILVEGRPVRQMDRREARAAMRAMDRGADATGGMRGKLEQALGILGEGIEVRVVDGRSHASVARAVQGAPVGTRLRP